MYFITYLLWADARLDKNLDVKISCSCKMNLFPLFKCLFYVILLLFFSLRVESRTTQTQTQTQTQICFLFISTKKERENAYKLKQRKTRRQQICSIVKKPQIWMNAFYLNALIGWSISLYCIVVNLILKEQRKREEERRTIIIKKQFIVQRWRRRKTY